MDTTIILFRIECKQCGNGPFVRGSGCDRPHFHEGLSSLIRPPVEDGLGRVVEYSAGLRMRRIEDSYRFWLFQDGLRDDILEAVLKIIQKHENMHIIFTDELPDYVDRSGVQCVFDGRRPRIIDTLEG